MGRGQMVLVGILVAVNLHDTNLGLAIFIKHPKIGHKITQYSREFIRND